MLSARWLSSASENRFQLSHDERNSKLTRNHLSTHLAWNSCEQGNTRSVWRGSKSQMQMTHDVWSPEWIIKELNFVLIRHRKEILTRVSLGIEFVIWELLDLQAAQTARLRLSKSLR